MADEYRTWRRQDAGFWRAHHEAWKRSDLNQRQYCEAEGIPLKAFGNWRAQFKAEPQPYRAQAALPPLPLKSSPKSAHKPPLKSGDLSLLASAASHCSAAG
jgi:hypothetical protein